MDSFSATAERSIGIAAAVTRQPESFRVVTGERPTGPLHLGQYFGAIRERVRLQEAGIDMSPVLADYQVITDRDTTAHVRENVYGAVLDYLAAGIHPRRATIFTHSSVSAQLLTYPVHQAADILFCKGNLVPVGKDNLPHVEMTRVIARRFNERYGQVFPMPDALITSAPEVPGLDGRTMSKSYGNSISLSMTPDETVDAIHRTRTDQDRKIAFDPERRPGVSALLSTAALCMDIDSVEFAEDIGDRGSGALKAATATAVNDFLYHRRGAAGRGACTDGNDLLTDRVRTAQRARLE